MEEGDIVPNLGLNVEIEKTDVENQSQEGDVVKCQLHDQRTTDLNADCVEFCICSGWERMLALGTYELQEERQERIGKVHLLEVLEVEGGKFQLMDVASLSGPGVFDIRWRECDEANEAPILGWAGADGSVAVLKLANNSLSLMERMENVCSLDGMCLSVDWGKVRTQSCNEIVCTSSAGTLSWLRLMPTGLRLYDSWKAHDSETWMCAMDAWKKNVLYTGADDCMLKVWDLRSREIGPCAVNRRIHTMGVCCMQSSPHEEGILATGSYDEKVRIWDVRNLSMPVLSREICVGGGIWRIKWHPHRKDVLLAAAMHAGFAVLRDETDSMSLLERWPGTLGYGADWYHGHVKRKEVSKGTIVSSLVGTCSFYERTFQLWSWSS